MRWNDHNPPHFHARYGDFDASFSIRDLKIIAGGLPKRIKVKVIKWAFEHRLNLMKNWELAIANKATERIPPLQ